MPNDLLEALAQAKLTGYEFKIILAICRKTHGWQGKMNGDRIPLSQFRKLTGIARTHCSRTLHKLAQRRVVTMSGNPQRPTWCINRTYSEWLPGMVTLPRMVTPITKDGNKGVTRDGNASIKDTVKDTIQKKESKQRRTRRAWPSDFSPEIQRLTSFLLRSLKKNLIKDFPDIEGKKLPVWQRNTAEALRLMHTQDKVSYREIRRIIQVVYSDVKTETEGFPGYGVVTLSGAKLRKHYKSGKLTGLLKTYKREDQHRESTFEEVLQETEDFEKQYGNS